MPERHRPDRSKRDLAQGDLSRCPDQETERQQQHDLDQEVGPGHQVISDQARHEQQEEQDGTAERQPDSRRRVVRGVDGEAGHHPSFHQLGLRGEDEHEDQDRERQ